MTGAADGVLFNGRFLTRKATGVDRFAWEILRARARQWPAHVADLAIPTGASEVQAVAPAGGRLRPTGRRQGHAWEQLELSRAAGADALVNFCNTAPLFRHRQMVVIHDAAAVDNPVNYSLAFRSWYRLMHGSIMRRSQVVATVSRFSADRLTAHFGKRRRGVEVIPEGGEHLLESPADAAVLDRLQLGGRRYVLAVGSDSPNKNFASVLRAVHALEDPDLLVVAAGGGNSRVFADAALQDPRLRRTGYVTDAELRALYENALCFAFPSFYEGFGLPPLEAMVCGCPVIVSDRASLPEVCGDAAVYCRAEDPATLAAAMRRLIDSAALRDELRQAGRARSALFGWDKAAAHFQQILDDRFA